MGKLKSSIWCRLSVALLVLFLLGACSEKEKSQEAHSENQLGASYSSDRDRSQSQKFKYMAYEHNLAVELDKSLIAEVHTSIVHQCEADTKYSCVVLNSNLVSGDYQSSNISLRLKSKGVVHFSKLAVQKGEVSSRSTKAQDLSDSIRDNAKRTEMATNYRDKLLLLEAKESDDIDAMVKIASELSKVQSELEFAQGERAKLFKKVETELLTINISSPRLTGFWGPIGDSLVSFKDDLAYGISDVISSSTSIIPWLIFLIILFLITRFIFRLVKAKK